MKIKLYLEIRWIIECIMIILFSPAIIFIIILFSFLLILDGKKNPFYSQYRIGLNCNYYRMYKLRTLTQSSDLYGHQVNIQNNVSNLCLFMRKYRIDEIPQFWNVLKKEMSIIGPRPDPIEYYNNITNAFPQYAERHDIRPGLTCIAQVKVGHTNDIDGAIRKFAYDIEYINNISLKQDVIILMQTIRVLLKQKY